MKVRFYTVLLLSVVVPPGRAQVASHVPTRAEALGNAPAAAPSALRAGDVPVARVNEAVLTDRDLLREMYAIFPYARQHNGFPKQMEPEIRKGALEMIIFEELVYQEAKRRHLAIPPARLARAEAELRKRFPSEDDYQQFLKAEMRGSRQVLREKIRRSLLIEALLKNEVQAKAVVSPAEAQAYYDKNPRSFEHGETFSLQTISIIPPTNASAEVRKEARQRAEEAWRQAKATHSYTAFGLLAEKISDDDWRVNMGDRHAVDRAQLPPPLVAAALKMQPGEVSDLLQLGPNYTLFRLNAHTPAGKTEFSTVRTQIQSELQKARYDELRAELHRKLRKNAKVQEM